MSLMDSVKGAAPAPKETAGAEKATTKKSNYEYQKAAKEKQKAAISTVVSYINEQKDVPAKVKEAVDTLTHVRAVSKGSALTGKAAIYKIFGDTPKAGNKVTALDVFQNTGKGFSDMKKLMKKWQEQNIVVEYDEELKSYVIKSGTIEPYSAE